MPVGNQSFLVDAKNNVGTIASRGNVYVNEAFPFIMNSYHMSISAASGGTQLPSVVCGKIELQNLSGNNVMWLGGTDTHAPSSGRGLELMPMSVLFRGEKIIYVNNANQIQICAQTSGQLIHFIAYGNGNNTVIDPATQGKAPPTLAPVYVP